LQDEFAALLHDYWKNPSTVVHNVLKDTTLWSTDLTKYAGLADAIQEYLNAYQTVGILETIQKINAHHG
jgi:tagaturonate reductase